MQSDDDKTQTHVPITSGTMILHYRIIEKIGAGGMGEVFLAEDTELNRRIALKFLPARFLSDPDCLARFRREAQAAARLNHPHIVTIHGVSEYHGRPFFVMEYVKGESLEKVIAAGRLSLDVALDIAAPIVEALVAAHESGITHRDIKPSNILIDGDGRPKILDFGLATVPGCEPVTKTGSTLGTLGYMAPEQVRSEPTDARSDLFSFGVVLYEMITGRRPFRGEIEAALLYAICYEEPEPLTHYVPETPEEVQRLVFRLLAKDPAQRYSSAADLLADIRRLGRHGGHQRPLTKPATTDPHPSIAVLPFANLSGDKEQEYFCDGISEEIINALTLVDGLRVAARTSAFSFRGKDDDIRDIGRKLGVEAILEGSVRKSGQRVRITTQLINVASGYHLWSERFDRDMEDIFAIQDEISLTIVDRLKVDLLQPEKARLVKRFTEDQEAYNLYLKGRYFWNKRYEGGLYRGLEYFQQAIEKDPSYALAYAGMADCYTILAPYSIMAPHKAFPQAKAAALRALELDDTVAEAHTSLAFISMLYDYDWVKAEKEFKRAIELNPSYATGHSWFSLHLICRGKTAEAMAEAELAQKLDPLSLAIGTYAGLVLWGAKRNDLAIEQLKRVIEMDPSFILAHRFLALCYTFDGRYDEAIAEVEKAAEISREDKAMTRLWLAIAYAYGGRRHEAQQALDDALEAAQGRYLSPYYTSYVFAGLGERDTALEWLEKAYTERDNWLCEVKMDPHFLDYHEEPRFKSLVKKIGLDS